MNPSMIDIMKNRRSVRTFQESLRQEDLKQLEEYLTAIGNPFDVPVTFQILNAEEHGLSSPVIVGAEMYMAAKVERVPNFEIALGYSFEQACLYACGLGIGTVILAASMNRRAFEKAMDVQPHEVMPVVSPLGYPAKKKSVRETMMRKAFKADQRKPFETLFSADFFDTELTSEEAGVFGEALEMVRWAPSATNQQPWRAVVKEHVVHFYEKQSIKESALGDIQKVDLGIALCHFDLAMKERDHQGQFIFQDPAIPVLENMHYIVSYQLTDD